MQLSIRGASRRRSTGALALVLVALSLLWPALAAAQTSVYCPTQSRTVSNGGSVAINVSTCDGPIDAGMSDGPPATPPVNGTYIIGPNSGGVQFVTYTHNGNAATTDTFTLLDEEAALLRINITITPPVSAITVSPTSLPTLTAGTPFSQTLTSTGGVAPYTYTLQGGTLPPGITLTSGGVLSGTPTQRGGYAFTVRSTDSNTAPADFADRGYTGTVQNPSVAITPASGTAIQGAAFSQALSVTGGVAPHSFLLETGSFPAGISISSAGVVSGTTAAAPGNYSVTLRVTDASTGPGSYFELEPYTLTVSPPPSVSIAVAPAAVSEDGATNLVYTVTRSLNLSSPTVVNITTSGTATAGVDYIGNAANVTIPAGATTATLTINPTVDGTVEADETAILTVAAGTGYTVGAPASAIGTILNDDVPTATIAVAPATVAEDGAPNLVFTVTLNQALSSPLSVGYTVGGTATNGTDYATITSPVTIAAGSTTGTVTVNPAADATIEADETVILTLSAGAGYTVGAPNTATGTILNDDLPNLAINDVTASEGNAGITNFTFTASLSAPAGPGGVGFDIATANGTATAGVDYVASSLSGQVIPAGSSTYTFSAQVNGDALNEANETFFVNITNVTGAVVVDAQGIGTITNDDPLPSLSIDDVTVVEGNSGTANAVFTVTLSAASGQAVGVNYATADGTATQPADYTSTSGTLNFTAGDTTRTITVPVIGETVPEANETYFVNLNGETNATIADNQGLGTISNDDVPITVGPATLPNGAVTAGYSTPITASGGVGPYTFAVTAGALPAGLTLSTAGVLAGTPTAGGSFNFTITATDASPAPGPFTGSQPYTLVIASPTLVLPPTPLVNGALGVAYNQTLNAASGGTAPYSYAVTAGALPGGLALNAATRVISGTVAAAGTFNFTVTATDSSTGTGPFTVSQTYSIVVAPITLAPPALPAGSVGAAYAQTLTASGGSAPYAFSVTAGALPAGVTLSAGGALGGTPTAGGTFNFTVTATDRSAAPGPFSGTQAYTLNVAAPTISLPPTTLAGGNTGTAYTATLNAASGGTAPYSYAITAGALPGGLTLNPATRVISGTPAAAGTFNFTITATDSSTGSGPYTATQTYVIAVVSIAINPATLPAATAATAYSQTLTASNGTAPYTFAVSAGALPAGLSLGSGGLLSGSPTAAGTFNFTVTATDAAGNSGSLAYALTVGAPTVSLAPATLPGGSAGTAYSQALTATGGNAPYAFTISAGALPAGITLSGAGLLSGTPVAAGTFNFTVTATDSTSGTPGTVSRAYSLVLTPPVIVVNQTTLPTVLVGVPYSAALTSSGGTAPYTYAVTAGALPPGLVLSPTGLLSGTPTAFGTFNFTITATDSLGFTGSRAYTLVGVSASIPVNAPWALLLLMLTLGLAGGFVLRRAAGTAR